MTLLSSKPANLDGVGLHDRVAQRHLAVAADGDLSLVAHAEDRGGMGFHAFVVNVGRFEYANRMGSASNPCYPARRRLG